METAPLLDGLLCLGQPVIGRGMIELNFIGKYLHFIVWI